MTTNSNITYWWAESVSGIDGSELAEPVERVFFSQKFQTKLSKQLAKLMFKILTPDTVVVPGRGGFYLISDVMDEYAKLIDTDLPQIVPYVSSAYAGENDVRDIKVRGLTEKIRKILENDPDAESVDDVVDTGVTTWTTLLQIFITCYQMNQSENLDMRIFTPFSKTAVFHKDQPFLIGVVHSIIDIAKWIVFRHEIFGFKLSHMYSVIENKRGNFKDILLDEKYPNITSPIFDPNQRLDASYALAAHYASQTFNGSLDSLPALVLAYLPRDETGEYNFKPSTVGLTVNEVLRAWSQIDIVKQYYNGDIDKMPPDADPKADPTPESGISLPYDVLTTNETGEWDLVGGGDYTSIVGSRNVLFVPELMPENLTKKEIASILGITEKQIQIASIYKGSQVDYHLAK